jgi:hypothetical protein
VSTNTFASFGLTYNTFSTFDQLDAPCAPSSGTNIAALIRGCVATSAKGFGSSATVGNACTLTSSVNSDGVTSTSLATLHLENAVAAYNTHLCAGNDAPSLVD